MKTIVWREYRLNRALLVAGALLMLMPYVFALVATFWPTEREIPQGAIADIFVTAAMASCGLSQLTVSLLGSNAIAGERADRSAEFMAYLPISRQRRVAGKFILTAAVAAVIWVSTLALIWGLSSSLDWNPTTFQGIRRILGYTAVSGFVMFGVGWFISSLQSSPTFAACGGIATPFVTLMGLQLTGYILSKNLSREEFNSQAHTQLMEVGYVSISLILGALGLGFGTWYFLKRVEP